MKKLLYFSMGLLVFIVSFMFVDMKLVENNSIDCREIIPKLNQFASENGYLPLDLVTIESRIDLEKCNYYVSDDTYGFVLIGSIFNLQAYVYDSKSNEWKWD